MTLDDVVGEAPETRLHYYDGTSRVVYATDVETRFPAGELIVSQTDPAGIITTCNEAFVLMSGFSREELLGQPHSILRHPDMPRAAFADLWQTVQEGRRWSGYVKNLRKDGGFYWVYATIIPKIRNGEIVGHTSVRREPSRKKVEEMAALYAQMLAQEEQG
ncbi:PAS domain-containing protein [Tessaracoccus sp. OH4464_COT-324]|uniref:PAS domain-containing protein n=1 Tax=Tessaracoccus sp. OH4464_COT-324 TaxID=2491059 RepID=UPI000F63762A|nr:PAS domain-containing protein [Tessaracoccus sp. OH4464_COT-324]RRD48067.1 PAS domain-containing protein [Tessaracoccus sp. OH4464_COT-324]